MISNILLAIVLLAIIYFKNLQFRYPLIFLYLLICCFFYFGKNNNIGIYGLFIFILLLITGVIKNNDEFHNCDEKEEFKNSSDPDNEEGIEQFGIADSFSDLHNMIHKLTKPK